MAFVVGCVVDSFPNRSCSSPRFCISVLSTSPQHPLMSVLLGQPKINRHFNRITVPGSAGESSGSPTIGARPMNM